MNLSSQISFGILYRMIREITKRQKGSCRCTVQYVPIPLTRENPLCLPTCTPAEAEEFIKEHNRWANFEALREKIPEVRAHVSALQTAIKDRDEATILRLYGQIEELRAPPFNTLHDEPLWDRAATLSNKNQSFFPNAAPSISRFLEKHYGDATHILEAMCGSWSYFKERPNREVIHIDCSETLLQRHRFPKRKRLQANFERDMEEICERFARTFDLISITLGLKYIRERQQFIRNLCRLLKKGGKIVFVEHPKAGYTHAIHNHDVVACWKALNEESGLSNLAITNLPIRTKRLDSEFIVLSGVYRGFFNGVAQT